MDTGGEVPVVCEFTVTDTDERFPEDPPLTLNCWVYWNCPPVAAEVALLNHVAAGVATVTVTGPEATV
jgi:hypothetical protein